MDLPRQIDVLRSEVDAITGIAPLHLQFAPIRLVTILEVFLRDVIAELVDGDEGAFERVDNLVKGARIDLAFAAHVDRRELTIGDFVAHSVPLNGVKGIMNIMDTLIGGFAGRLKTAHPRWSEDAEQWPLAPIVADHDATRVALGRLFEVRQVLTHELPDEIVFDPEELSVFIEATQRFIDATDWSVVEILHGSVPKTRIAINMAAGDDLHSQKEELELVLKKVEALSG